MNIDGLRYQFNNESPLRYSKGRGQGVKSSSKDYTDADVTSFIYDVNEGMTIADSAKLHGIPSGTAYSLLPKAINPKNKVLALKMVKQKLAGELKVSFRSISEVCGYSHTGIILIKKRLIKAA